jgi:hypothetical protein
MADETVFIGLGVAYLTGNLVLVRFMRRRLGRCGYHFGMALAAPWPLGKLKPCSDTGGVGMQILSRMAVHAGHFFTRIVHIRCISFVGTGKLAMHPAAVATGAGCVHGRRLDKMMAIQKSAPDIIRTTDMALAATGVTTAAVLGLGPADFFKYPMITFGRSGHDRTIKGCQRIMQAVFGGRHDFRMAFPADVVGLWESGVLYHLFVSGLPVSIGRISAVAILAGNLAVLGFQEGRFDINFLV